ncbi:hypothetical protein FRC10_012040 [Ceratobasidium sp. 414]|nr:hypothetical protein FRC10_012040 [Ceratobasidium sp. 414]
MAQTNGHEVYQYSIYDSPSTQSVTSILPSNHVSGPKRSSPQPNKSPSPEGIALALEAVSVEHMGTFDEEDEDEGAGSDSDSVDSDSDEMSEDEGETVLTALDRPIIQPIKHYRGAGNIKTVKDVNFLGPNDEFVTSGSDDGNWFLWSKKSGDLLGIWEGDGSVVNMVEGHPSLPIVAVSGIDETIKIFEPTPGVKRSSRLGDAQQVIQGNETANSADYISGRSVLVALHALRAAGHLPDIDGGPECPTQ